MMGVVATASGTDMKRPSTSGSKKGKNNQDPVPDCDVTITVNVLYLTKIAKDNSKNASNIMPTGLLHVKPKHNLMNKNANSETNDSFSQSQSSQEGGIALGKGRSFETNF